MVSVATAVILQHETWETYFLVMHCFFGHQFLEIAWNENLRLMHAKMKIQTQTEWMMNDKYCLTLYEVKLQLSRWMRAYLGWIKGVSWMNWMKVLLTLDELNERLLWAALGGEGVLLFPDPSVLYKLKTSN